MRLIFFSGCTVNTAVCQHRQAFTFILPLFRLAVAWLCSDSLWSMCLTCQDVFANLNTKMEARNIAQRYAILFCVKLGDSATRTHGKLQQVFGDDAMSRAQTFRCHKTFSQGRTIAEVEQRSGRPSATRTSDSTARVCELVRSDRRLTVKMIADEVNVSWEAVRGILTEELGMGKICAKMVPRNLTEQQRHARVSVCAELLEQVEADEELMERVITGDESWFIQYDPDTKRQSLEWCSKGSPRRKKARMSKSKVKCTLVCFFDSIGIVHK